MRKKLQDFLLAILAGIAIGIGGTVFLAVDNRVTGAILFSIGLYTVCAHGLNLYTGKVGYAVEKPLSYWGFLAPVWAGNLTGTALIGLALRCTRMVTLADKAASMCAVKSADSLLSLFVLGIFCGVLMYAAVEGYRRTKNPLILVGCVSAFILCGFEHCVADMFYYFIGGAWSLRAVIVILVITAGNSIGGMLIPFAQGLVKEKE